MFTLNEDCLDLRIARLVISAAADVVQWGGLQDDYTTMLNSGRYTVTHRIPDGTPDVWESLIILLAEPDFVSPIDGKYPQTHEFRWTIRQLANWTFKTGQHSKVGSKA